MVDGTGLENRQVNSLAGSNPVPSAKLAKGMKTASQEAFQALRYESCPFRQVNSVVP